MNIGIFFGGNSEEHLVSIMTAKVIINNIKKDKYNIFLFYIDKKSVFHHIKNFDEIKELEIIDKKKTLSHDILEEIYTLDIAFNIIHGPFGEDGRLQGFFETLNIKYIGSNVLGSAICMDKITTKRLFNALGIKTARFFAIEEEFNDEIYNNITKYFNEYPLFVKPSNMGSSIGISKVENESELKEAINFSLKYDSRILIEEGIKGREVECGVLEDDGIIVSDVGEIVSFNDFYDYEAKYFDDGKEKMKIPADIDDYIKEEIQKISKEVFTKLSCKGLVRVDFFVREKEIIISELNTLPGMTEFSMYPLLFNSENINYSELLDKLIKNACK